MAKARRIKGIAPEKNLDECARRIITTQFNEMMAFKAEVIDSKDIKYLHQMRVTSRRLRAAMLNFADCFPRKKKFRRHLKQVRRITDTLGDARDLDVLIDRFEKTAKTVPEDAQVDVKNLIKHLQQERKKKRVPILRMFEGFDSNNFEKKFLKFFEG